MKNNCASLHACILTLPRYKFPYDESIIPLHGIYILFEKGERSHAGERIVRVGTHTGKDQLRSRLRQHFIVENKDRSIFRKNIGRCFLHHNADPYASVWEADRTSKASKEKYVHMVDVKAQLRIEKKVTEYLQKNFSFAILEVQDKEERLELESKMISTISLCPECLPSKNWLGLFSPKEKIRESGLWLVNELYKKPLEEKDMKRICKLADRR
jgi:hypothetical protein